MNRQRSFNPDTANPVLLLGATGQVGHFLLKRLLGNGSPVIAISRRVPAWSHTHLTWLQQDLNHETMSVRSSIMLSAGPLQLALKQAFHMSSLNRLIALSSASTRFKQHSSDPAEQRMIERLIDTESQLIEMAKRRGIALTLLKPTLIHGGPGPQALDPIREWMRQHRLVPVAGNGLRQPVHADDLAALMARLITRRPNQLESFELGGGETLPYADFLRRIASGTGREIRIVRIPAWCLAPSLRAVHLFGRMPGITPAMLRRQRMDLVIDDHDAREQLGWNPRPFRPVPDAPKSKSSAELP